MPKSTMEEAEKWPLEEDHPYKAQLIEVTEKHTPGGISKRTGNSYEAFSAWIWKFEVTEGQKLGQWAWADTDDVLTTLYGSKRVRTYAEALRGKPYELGEGIDTDDLIGMQCYIEVANESWTKPDGTEGYRCPVVNAYALADVEAPTEDPWKPGPAAQADPWASGTKEPPF